MLLTYSKRKVVVSSYINATSYTTGYDFTLRICPFMYILFNESIYIALNLAITTALCLRSRTQASFSTSRRFLLVHSRGDLLVPVFPTLHFTLHDNILPFGATQFLSFQVYFTSYHLSRCKLRFHLGQPCRPGWRPGCAPNWHSVRNSAARVASETHCIASS